MSEVVKPEVTKITKGQILTIENPKLVNKMLKGKRVEAYEIRPDGLIAAHFVDKADIERWSAKMYIFDKSEFQPAITKAKAGNPGFTIEESKSIGEKLDIDFNRYDVGQFRQGLNVELEHCNVTGCDPFLTGKIALAHLSELPDYYTRLAIMEKGGNLMDSQTKKEIADKEAMEEASRIHKSPLADIKGNEVVNKFLPMMPEEGPPLPRVLNIRWPWKER